MSPLTEYKKETGFEKKCTREKFPFIDIYWDSIQKAPGLFCESLLNGNSDLEDGTLSLSEKGVEFGLYKTGVLIGDEMGLGKTLQAIALGILKKEKFDFSKVLIVTLASLK